MTTIISIPNQVQHIQQAHTAILKSFTDNFIVFGSLGEFEDQKKPTKPDIIILDFAWLSAFNPSLNFANPRFPDINETPIILVKFGFTTERDFNGYGGNVVAVVPGEEQTPDNFLYHHMMSERSGTPLTDEQLNCGLRGTIQRVLELQAEITDRPITRFDISGKGARPKKHERLIP